MNIRVLLTSLAPNKIVIRRLSKGIGDNLMLSHLAKEIKKKYPFKKIIIETEYPELFINNPNVYRVSKGKQFPFYVKPKYNIDCMETAHVLDQLLSNLPFSLPLRSEDRKLEMHLTSSEKDSIREHVPSRYVVIGPVGKSSFSANRKEWGFDRFQRLVDLLPELSFVQIGIPKDPLLNRVIDLRTVGYPLRRCAAVIENSMCGVFLEGGFMHLSNAVGKSSVIIYGGALRPEVTGYPSHINLFRKVECGPCFTSDKRMSICPTMVCMEQISPEEVADAVRRLLKKTEN